MCVCVCVRAHIQYIKPSRIIDQNLKLKWNEHKIKWKSCHLIRVTHLIDTIFNLITLFQGYKDYHRLYCKKQWGMYEGQNPPKKDELKKK